jgi:NADPH:quinone reductase-like Zn-dependent oxidoreductase
MRAVVATEYGGPEVLELVDIGPLEVAPDCLRVRVLAAGVNPVDNAIRAGYLRDYLSPTFPFVLGFDVAGVVDTVGADVTAFGAGDAVVGHLLGEGMRCGAYGEYVIAHPDWFVGKPDALTFRQAAAVPHAALTASQALSELDVASGDTVLIHAAAGGVGSFAVQLARLAGARVIGTASPANHDYLRGLGAEPVSYEHDLVLQVRQLSPSGVDVILDLIGGDELEQSVPLLSPGGRIASTVDYGVARFGGHLVVGHPDTDRLAQLVAMVAAGDLKVEIAAVYPLPDVPAALELVGRGHVRGKVVIDVDTGASSPEADI